MAESERVDLGVDHLWLVPRKGERQRQPASQRVASKGCWQGCCTPLLWKMHPVRGFYLRVERDLRKAGIEQARSRREVCVLLSAGAQGKVGGVVALHGQCHDDERRVPGSPNLQSDWRAYYCAVPESSRAPRRSKASLTVIAIFARRAPNVTSLPTEKPLTLAAPLSSTKLTRRVNAFSCCWRRYCCMSIYK